MSKAEPKDEPIGKTQSKITSLITVLIVILVFFFGLALLVVVHQWDWLKQHENFATLLRELGAVLSATVAVATLWELFAKRSFIDELMAKAQKSLASIIAETRVADEVREAGLRAFTKDFWHGIDWLTLFKDAHTLDLFFAYARSWVGGHAAQLQELSRHEGARIRVVLPNPENPQVISDLAHRFGRKAEDVRGDIEDTVKDLMAIFVEPFEDHAGHAKPNFSLYFCSKAPVFTFYRFDKLAVIALYKHRSGRGGIPVFVAEKRGSLFDFISDEMDGFVNPTSGSSTRVYPPITPKTSE